MKKSAFGRRRFKPRKETTGKLQISLLYRRIVIRNQIRRDPSLFIKYNQRPQASDLAELSDPYLTISVILVHNDESKMYNHERHQTKTDRTGDNAAD